MKPVQKQPSEHKAIHATPTVPYTASELQRANTLKHIAKAVLEIGIPHEPLIPITKPLKREITKTFTGTYPNLRPIYLQSLETIQEEHTEGLTRSEPKFR